MSALELKEIVRLIEHGEASSARARLEAIIASDPGYAAAHVALAMAHDAESQYDESVVAWRNAYRLAPDSPAAEDGLKRSLRDRLVARLDSELVETAARLGIDWALLSDVEQPAVAELEADRFVDDSGSDSAEVTATQPAAEPVAEPATEPVAEPAAEPATEPSAAPAAEPANAPESPRVPDWMDVSALADTLDLVSDTAAIEDESVDLDGLIRELESARIVPDPTVQPIKADEIESHVEDMVSETLARIYANQKFYAEAAEVYEKLADQQPNRSEEFRGKAAAARAGLA